MCALINIKTWLVSATGQINCEGANFTQYRNALNKPALAMY